jgi:hypothetical protein
VRLPVGPIPDSKNMHIISNLIAFDIPQQKSLVEIDSQRVLRMGNFHYFILTRYEIGKFSVSLCGALPIGNTTGQDHTDSLVI